MKLELRVLDDLKTERAEIAPPLPAAMRIVPLGFYLSVVATIGLCGYFAFQLREVTASRDSWQARMEETKTRHRAAQQERKQLEEEAKRASDLLGWVESTRALQPLIVGIGRSMENDATITQLALTRDGENSAQIRIAVKLNTNDIAQLDRTLQSVFDQDYRAYSPQQTLSRGEIDYQAMLLWQDSGRAVTPDE